jgi:uroporphyrinogen-III synthase
MSFQKESGVFVVRYESPADLDPARQRDLVAAIRAVSAVAPVGVVFVVSPDVQMVGHEVPDYWLTVTSDKGVRLAAIAVVTPNPAVSVATRGFSTANILKDTSVAVKPFAEEGPALEWVKAEVAKRK